MSALRGVMSLAAVVLGFAAIAATVAAASLWASTTDEVIAVSTLDGTIYCDGRFPDTWTGSRLTSTEASRECVDAREDGEADRWRMSVGAVAAGVLTYWLLRLAHPEERRT